MPNKDDTCLQDKEKKEKKNRKTLKKEDANIPKRTVLSVRFMVCVVHWESPAAIGACETALRTVLNQAAQTADTLPLSLRLLDLQYSS